MKKFWIVILVLLMGCVPWMKVGGTYKNSHDKYSVDLPQGWMKLNADKSLFITRDGGLLQNIIVERVDLDEPLKNTKKKLSKNMLPLEASEVIIDNISSDKAVLNLVILENIPVTIDRNQGFKILFTYKNKDGLKFKSLYCGFLFESWLYNIRYTAAERYYFSKDVGVFEELLNSFKLS
jgi:hypothetical protein